MMTGSNSFRIPFIRPSFPPAAELAKDYDQIVKINRYTNFGPFERRFAKHLGRYFGDDYTAVTFSSATAGLMAAVLAALGQGDNDQFVLMPSFTFAAGADALIWCGYQPLFIDIETKGLQMDIKQAEVVLEKNGRDIAGILFCNAFGVGTTNIEAWEELARRYNKPLVIDSAAGFGSIYSQKRKVGTAGVCEIFSFHATKSFAIGEGGAVITKDKSLAEKMLEIQNFGFSRQSREATQLGFNGKLQEINAAIGLRQFDRFKEVLSKRQSILKHYKHELKADRFKIQENAEQASLCFATIAVNHSDQRDVYVGRLSQKSVEVKTYYNPSLHKQPFFQSAKTFGQLKNTELIDQSVISLPVYDSLSQSDVDTIINVLNA